MKAYFSEFFGWQKVNNYIVSTELLIFALNFGMSMTAYENYPLKMKVKLKNIYVTYKIT